MALALMVRDGARAPPHHEDCGCATPLLRHQIKMAGPLQFQPRPPGVCAILVETGGRNSGKDTTAGGYACSSGFRRRRLANAAPRNGRRGSISRPRIGWLTCMISAKAFSTI